MESGDRFALWPMCNTEEGWSVPDALLERLWERMVEAGRASRLFYSGTIRDAYEWIDWLKTPGNFPVIVMDARDKTIAAMSWLNNMKDGSAQIHFVMFGLSHPGIGKKVLDYYSKFPGLCVIVGVTPAHYSDALRYAKKIGFKPAGLIPRMLSMTYENKRADAVITYYEVGR